MFSSKLPYHHTVSTLHIITMNVIRATPYTGESQILIQFKYALALLIFLLLCLFGFGLVVYNRAPIVAPRTRNRPPETMVFENLLHKPARSKFSEFCWGCFGWIAFVLSLSYDEMLTGVRGTGSRYPTDVDDDVDVEDPLASASASDNSNLLKCNMDAIVVDRFHEMCLKITFWVTLIAMTVSFPVNFTASCYDLQQASGLVRYDTRDYPTCPIVNSTMNDFDRTTIANIENAVPPDGLSDSEFSLNFNFHTFGLALALCLISYIVCKIVKNEWAIILRLRREYYLEENHFGNNVIRQSVQSSLPPNPTWEDKTFALPYLRDPDKPDTLPSIELYSVLIGNLPQKPTDVVASEDDGQLVDLEARRNALKMISSVPTVEWQLAITSAMFDTAIPAGE